MTIIYNFPGKRSALREIILSIYMQGNTLSAITQLDYLANQYAVELY